MENQTKRFVILMVLSVVFLALTLGVFQSNKALDQIDIVQEATSEKVLDSIINKRIDYRYTSYDNRFFYTNAVVVDQHNNIIGKIYLNADFKKIDSFYNSNPEWRKTKFYNNIKDGTLKIIQKDEINN